MYLKSNVLSSGHRYLRPYNHTPLRTILKTSAYCLLWGLSIIEKHNKTMMHKEPQLRKHDHVSELPAQPFEEARRATSPASWVLCYSLFL